MSNIRPDLSIDYSYIRVPYDAGVRTFKASKKTIEKDMSSILNSIIALKKEKQLKASQTKESLDSFITRLKGLKRKLDENYREEEEIYECCKKRLIQLDEVDLKNKESIGKYQNFRVQNLIVEYLVRNDYHDTAKMVTEDCGTREFMSIDTKVIQEHNTILNELKNRNCETALHWCQTNKTKLLKTNSRLELKLMFQEFIELIKKNQQDKAMLYLRKYSEAMKSQNIEAVRKAMGCLTFSKQLDKFPDYQYYFEEDRWDDLISMFKQDSFLVSGITTQSNLEITLQAGLSALKTESCMNHSMQKPDTCPVCNPHMRKLANKVPATHKMVSSLICRLSGDVMDEHNPPVALPNGQVYSEKALTKMAEKEDGKIVCPASKMEYTLQDVKKIYIS